MNDSATTPATEQNASPCCAAIAELQRRAQHRAEQRTQDSEKASPAAPTEPARDA
ncbi:hypothetical protein [Streptomyces sp. NPDC029554]|uniref:hypothetical protein n=1 Tax=Streptomyces sp. NPDC029554 TaxID=3155126 RepID=UPI0033DC6BBD